MKMNILNEAPYKIFDHILTLYNRGKYLVPITLFMILLLTMFVVEIGIMGLLFVLPEMPGAYAIFLDGFLLTLISCPVLFYLYLRPMLNQIKLQQESERRFRAVFEQTFQFMCILQSDGTILQANHSVILAGNMVPDEIVGKLFWDAFHELIAYETHVGLQTAVRQASYGKVTRIEGDFYTSSGQTLTVDFSIKPIMDEKQQVKMIILEGRDITRHKDIENKLRAEVVKRKENEQHIQQSEKRAVTLSEILSSLQNVNENYQSFLETTVQKTAELLHDGCIIYLLSDTNQQLLPTAFHHIHPPAHQVMSSIVANEPIPILEESNQLETSLKQPLFLPHVEPVHLKDQLLLKCQPFFQKYGLNSLMVLPMQIQDRFVGTLCLFRDQTPDPYSLEDLNFVQNIALKVAIAIHNTHLYHAERHSRQTAETLSASALALTKTLKLEYIFNQLLDCLEQLIPFNTACLALLEDEKNLAVRTTRGRNIWTEPNKKFDINSRESMLPLLDVPLHNHQSHLIPDTHNTPQSENSPDKSNFRNWLGVPLIAGDNVIGLCLFGNETESTFTQEHIQWAEALLSQAAIAIQNAWLFEQIRAGRKRLQSLSHRLVEVQENERRYVARELHDEAGQALTSLMVGLRLIERDAHHPEAVLAGTAELKKMVDEVLENLHRLAVRLRPASLDHLGLLPALQQHIGSLSTRHGLLIQFETMGVETRLREPLETVLYRIVQEALTNVVKHAQATRVDILLERRGEKLITIVEDNGIGFDTSKSLSSEHLGLFGMRERLELFRGSLHLESTPQTGTTLLVEIPYETQDFDRR